MKSPIKSPTKLNETPLNNKHLNSPEHGHGTNLKPRAIVFNTPETNKTNRNNAGVVGSARDKKLKFEHAIGELNNS